jgi:dihydrodipicolinate synthase/N-acetylneuraminate lyase
MVTPSFDLYTRSNEDMMYRHFNTVADAVPEMEIILYDAHAYSEIPVHIIKKLAENCSNVKYVKTQIGNTKVTRIIDSLGDKMGVFCGTDTYLVQWLQLGCIGGTNSTPNVIPMHVRKIYEAALRKDWNSVSENWFKCWPVINAFYGFGGGSRRTYKHALYWLGIFDNHEHLRYTGGGPSEEALQYTRKALDDLGMKLIR